MDRKEWMRQEIAGWRDEGLVDGRTAETLIARYASTAGRISWGVMLAGGFGALMIGLGIIALFAANWDCFGRPARAAISLAPVVLCGLVALVASVKGWKASSFWEPLGILWAIATGAATCLVAQTYQVGGSVPGLILFVSLLTLPVVWITRSVALIGAWPILAVVWTCVSRETADASVPLGMEAAALMALSLPAYIAFLRRQPGRAALVTGQLVTGLVYSFGAGLMLAVALPIGDGATGGVLVFWACSAAVALVALVFRLPVWPFVATLVAAGASIPTAMDNEAFALYPVALILSVGIIAYGVRKLRLSYTNVGAALFLILVLTKFFESRIDFTVKGVVLILAGAALTALNVIFVRYRKGRA